MGDKHARRVDVIGEPADARLVRREQVVDQCAVGPAAGHHDEVAVAIGPAYTTYGHRAGFSVGQKQRRFEGVKREPQMPGERVASAEGHDSKSRYLFRLLANQGLQYFVHSAVAATSEHDIEIGSDVADDRGHGSGSGGNLDVNLVALTAQGVGNAIDDGVAVAAVTA